MADAPPAEPALTTSDALLRQLEWRVLKRLDGLLQGDYRSLWRGGGVDLADLREYQLHDDVRHIDWNVTARLQVPYVRQYTEDRDLTAWMLLDLSGSVDFGSTERTKLAVSTAFVALLARVLTRHGNRVGALLFDGRRLEALLQPASSRQHVLNLLARLRQPRQARSGAQSAKGPATGPTVLAELLCAAERSIRRRSLVFVVSDFISTPGWESPLARLSRRHELVAVRLFDPAERQLPDVGLATLQDAETGEQLLVDAGDPAFRARYEALAAQHEARLLEALAASGADTLELATDDDLLQALLRVAALRRQRVRAGAPPARWMKPLATPLSPVGDRAP